MQTFSQHIVDVLRAGGVGVIPTDTIYGVVGRAEVPTTVERIYVIRKRRIHKPCIVLISSYEDLKKFGIEIAPAVQTFLETHHLWPGKVSVVFPCPGVRFDYLGRGTKSIAFRIPDVPELRDLLARTGPLVAPSANLEGEPSATTIDMARAAFQDSVDFYVDGGTLDNVPSTLITFENEKPVVLRQGATVV